MTQDLTQITSPFGLLDKETRNALKAACLYGKALQLYGNEGVWKTIGGDPLWHNGSTYRVKPTPVTVSNWFNVCDWGVGCSYSSREEADYVISSARINRIAVLRIDNTDGELTFHKEDV